jgi:hypothetical protein
MARTRTPLCSATSARGVSRPTQTEVRPVIVATSKRSDSLSCLAAYHTYCLDPPLQALPPEDADWFCSWCLNRKRPRPRKRPQVDGGACEKCHKPNKLSQVRHPALPHGPRGEGAD